MGGLPRRPRSGLERLMCLGLLSPAPCAGFVGLMTVAALTDHAGKGFFVFKRWVAGFGTVLGFSPDGDEGDVAMTERLAPNKVLCSSVSDARFFVIGTGAADGMPSVDGVEMSRGK